jgi:hypothetical protein
MKEITLMMMMMMIMIIIIIIITIIMWAGMALSVQRLPTDGDLIPVRAIFSAPVLTSPGAHLAPVQWVPRHSRGLSGRRVTLTTHHYLTPRLKA